MSNQNPIGAKSQADTAAGALEYVQEVNGITGKRQQHQSKWQMVSMAKGKSTNPNSKWYHWEKLVVPYKRASSATNRRAHLTGCMSSCSPEHVYDDNRFVRVDVSVQHTVLQHSHPFSCYQLLNIKAQTLEMTLLKTNALKTADLKITPLMTAPFSDDSTF